MSDVEMFYEFVGKIFFSRQPDWERQRNAKVMTWVVVVALVFGAALVGMLKLFNGKL